MTKPLRKRTRYGVDYKLPTNYGVDYNRAVPRKELRTGPEPAMLLGLFSATRTCFDIC